MKDTKGIRQVLVDLIEPINRSQSLQQTNEILGEAEAKLQEIMLGMKPDNPYKAVKKNPQKTEVQKSLAVAEHAFETATRLWEQNIRGGFNNG